MRTIIMSCMMIKSTIIFALLTQQMVHASPFFLVQAPQQQSQPSTMPLFLPFLGQRVLPTAAPSPTPAPGAIPSTTPRIRSATRTATSMAQQRQITTVAATVQGLINTLMTAKLNWFVNLITSGGQSMNQPRTMPTTATPITTLPSFVFMPPSPLNVSTPPAPPATTSETSTSAPAATTDSFIASTDSASAATDNPPSNPIDTTAAADTTLIPQAPTGNPVPIVVDPNFDLRWAYSETLQNGLASGDDIEDNEDTSTVISETESTIPNDTQDDNVRELDAADAIPENDNDTDGSDSFIKKSPPTRAPRREKKNKDRKEKEGKKKNNQRRLTSTKVSSNDDDDQRLFSFSDIVGEIIDAGVITTEKSDSSDIVTDGDVIKTKKIRAKPNNPANLLRADSDTDAITTIPRVKKYKKPKKSSSKKKPKVNKKEQQGEEGGDI